MLVTLDDLRAVFRLKYGDPGTVGPGPARRLRFGYFTPDDYYETVVNRLVIPGCRWLDVGGGRDVFPSNPELARQLATRCGRLVGVDPSPNVHENPFVHERHESFIENFRSDEPFDLLTLRMVAEHITQPGDAMAAMARLLKPGGRVVIYTIHKFTPVSVVAWVVPFCLHHPIKRRVWHTEDKDTFPVAYRMNTRRDLRRLAAAHGLAEERFAYLDDCRTFHRFPALNTAELALWKALSAVGLRYPETCLLGVYRKS